MLNFTLKDIDRAFERTGSRIQKVLDSQWLMNDIQLLGRNLGLTVGQTGDLTKIISYILLDLVPLSKFIDTLETELVISHQRAKEIAEKTDESIFAKIREGIIEDEEEKREAVREKQVVEISDSKPSREELLREIEEHAKKLEEEKKNPTEGIETLNEVVSTGLEEKKIDPYRESIDG